MLVVLAVARLPGAVTLPSEKDGGTSASITSSSSSSSSSGEEGPRDHYFLSMPAALLPLTALLPLLAGSGERGPALAPALARELCRDLLQTVLALSDRGIFLRYAFLSPLFLLSISSNLRLPILVFYTVGHLMLSLRSRPCLAGTFLWSRCL